MKNKITEQVFQNRESIRMSRSDFDDYITQERERIINIFQDGIMLPADTIPGSIRKIQIFNEHLRCIL